jgi:solute carrier family 45 protein 1/2/4
MIRASGAGNIMGYLAGMVKLPVYFPFLGDTQFKVLCAIACIILALTVSISVVSCPERNPRWDGAPQAQDGVIAFFKGLAASIRKLPLQIRRVCEVQFFAWIGWFPFLFYISTYIGQIYVNPHLEKNPNMSNEEIDALWEDATRAGTQALLIFAITTFAASIVLPFVIPPTYSPPRDDPATPMTPTTPHSMSGGGYFNFNPSPRKPLTFSDRLDKYLNMIQIESLTLRRAWILSHLMFAGLMALTFFVHNTFTATALVALIGVPWALTNWAPFALLSSEISKRDAMRRGFLPVSPNEDEDAEEQGGEDQAGVILGIHNVAIAAPQVIATLVSSVIFKFLQKPRGAAGDDSVAWVLRFGGCCAIIAAYMTTRVKEEKDDGIGEISIPQERRRRVS